MKCLQPTSKPISSTVHAKVLDINDYKNTNKKNGPFTSGQIPWWTISGQKNPIVKSSEFPWWLVPAVARSRGKISSERRFPYNPVNSRDG